MTAVRLASERVMLGSRKSVRGSLRLPNPRMVRPVVISISPRRMRDGAGIRDVYIVYIRGAGRISDWHTGNCRARPESRLGPRDLWRAGSSYG